MCDNAYPTSPLVGPGSFQLSSNSSINPTGDGLLKIYTAMRLNNQIDGTLRGVNFVPGPLYVDTDTEVWNHYYPNSPEGNPYTIYYKLAEVEIHISSDAEKFINFHSLSEYITRYLAWQNFFAKEFHKNTSYFFIREKDINIKDLDPPDSL